MRSVECDVQSQVKFAFSVVPAFVMNELYLPGDDIT